ncbi:response regulator transcription factor [Rahnella bruchi]|uniref:response regulator transcription factor n=1 Tax=Rahnella bruchi TaxID=1510573 RepID=UPI000EA17A56|nr:response regulator transcription factor [Rahnella bruchi]
MRKAIIVDDHPFILASVRLLVINAGFEVVAECGNGIDAVQQCQKHQPDLMILDLAIPGLDGLDVIRRLKEKEIPTKIIVLSSQQSEQFTLRCLQAGAVGYVSKKDNLSILTDVINAAMAGYSFFPQLTLDAGENTFFTGEAQKLAALSNREMMVMKYLVNGLNNKQIAESLSLSEKTVSTYKSRVLEKLNVSTVLALAEMAQRHEIE